MSENSPEKELKNLVLKLTSSGKEKLDEKQLTKLKSLCRKSSQSLFQVYTILIQQLKRNHAEVRLSSLQIISELFTRSHLFRERLLNDFRMFLDLTLGIDNDFPLPPPRPVALRLRQMSLSYLDQWNKKYGCTYPKLSLACEYLVSCKKVNFTKREALSEVERSREEEQRAIAQAARAKQLDRITTDIKDHEDNIQDTLTQINSLFDILLPSPDTFDIYNWCSEGGRLERTLAIQNEKIDSATDGHVINPHDTCNDDDKSLIDTRLSSNGLNVDDKSSSCVKDELMFDNNGRIQSPHRDDEGDDTSISRSLQNSENDVESSDLRLYGMSSNTTVSIRLDDIATKETDENSDIIRNLRELISVIDIRFLPLTKKWLHGMGKVGADDKDVKRVIDLKSLLLLAKDKYSKLNISANNNQPAASCSKDWFPDSDDEVDDFEEVPDKEGYEPVIPPNKRQEYGLDPIKSYTRSQTTTSKLATPDWSIGHLTNDPSDPTTRAATLSKCRHQNVESCHTSPSADLPSCSSLQADIPVLPMGYNADNWVNSDSDEPMPCRPVLLHPFWHSKDAEDKLPPNVQSKHERSIAFTGTFEPVTWACRVPLPSGKLCPRMDRHKCPFHGPIISRDSSGQPNSDADKKKYFMDRITADLNKSQSNWEDVELQRDIELATGISLVYKAKGRGRGQHRRGQLTDLKAATKTSRARLNKKIFNRRSLKRVATKMNTLEQKRHIDKFAMNFQYVCEK